MIGSCTNERTGGATTMTCPIKVMIKIVCPSTDILGLKITAQRDRFVGL